MSGALQVAAAAATGDTESVDWSPTVNFQPI